jgi:hypothetical protein
VSFEILVSQVPNFITIPQVKVTSSDPVNVFPDQVLPDPVDPVPVDQLPVSNNTILSIILSPAI